MPEALRGGELTVPNVASPLGDDGAAGESDPHGETKEGCSTGLAEGKEGDCRRCCSIEEDGGEVAPTAVSSFVICPPNAEVST